MRKKSFTAPLMGSSVNTCCSRKGIPKSSENGWGSTNNQFPHNNLKTIYFVSIYWHRLQTLTFVLVVTYKFFNNVYRPALQWIATVLARFLYPKDELPKLLREHMSTFYGAPPIFP